MNGAAEDFRGAEAQNIVFCISYSLLIPSDAPRAVYSPQSTSKPKLTASIDPEMGDLAVDSWDQLPDPRHLMNLGAEVVEENREPWRARKETRSGAGACIGVLDCRNKVSEYWVA